MSVMAMIVISIATAVGAAMMAVVAMMTVVMTKVRGTVVTPIALAAARIAFVPM